MIIRQDQRPFGDEKMKKLVEENHLAAIAIWDCGSPLYDSYELASLGHLLDRHTMASPFFCRSSRFLIPTSVLDQIMAVG